MSQNIELVYPKLTEDNLKLLESQISNLELLSKLRSRCGKLPTDVRNQISSVIDSLTSAIASEPVPKSPDDNDLLSFKRAWTEFVLTFVKEWPSHNDVNDLRHLDWRELCSVLIKCLDDDKNADSAFLDMYHTFCEKSQRSPESPQ